MDRKAIETWRLSLDRFYDAFGAIAAFFIVALFLIVLAQMVGRWFNFTVPGATNYAAYCLAAASFFALANTFRHGALIRMRILLDLAPARARWLIELWCHAIGGGLAVYFLWYAIRGVQVSIKLNDISQGQDATPLWIPQIPLAVGSAVLVLAFLDRILVLLVTGQAAEAERLHTRTTSDGEGR